MSARGVWEEPMFSSNAPLPKRPMTADHPMYGLPRQYIADDLVLQPWGLLALAPVLHEWEPLAKDHESVYLMREQKVRQALVDYSEGVVVAWRQVAGSKAYQSRKPRPEPPP